MNKRHPRYDFNKDEVFSGYDPVADGFAYPHPDCTCQIVKPPGALRPDERFDQTVARICDHCFDRLTAEPA